jgi:hypothetical protein
LKPLAAWIAAHGQLVHCVRCKSRAGLWGASGGLSRKQLGRSSPHQLLAYGAYLVSRDHIPPSRPQTGHQVLREPSCLATHWSRQKERPRESVPNCVDDGLRAWLGRLLRRSGRRAGYRISNTVSAQMQHGAKPCRRSGRRADGQSSLILRATRDDQWIERRGPVRETVRGCWRLCFDSRLLSSSGTDLIG